jgi:hypothetical protein
MEKRELGKIDFDLIDAAFTALLQSHPDPVTADKVVDLRDKSAMPSPAGWRLSKRPRPRRHGQKIKKFGANARGLLNANSFPDLGGIPGRPCQF